MTPTRLHLDLPALRLSALDYGPPSSAVGAAAPTRNERIFASLRALTDYVQSRRAA